MKLLRLLIPLALCALPLTASAETRVPSNQAEIALGFAPVVQRAAPAVVNIYAKRIVQAQVSPFADDPFFSSIFRDLGPRRPQVQNSLGSGVILSPDGIVVSNYHVVGQASDIRVVLNDRRAFTARVLLADRESDLAVLQLEGASDMPALPLRDSDSVAVGELALAIGNPFGIGQTVTSGIISGLARSGTATGNERGYFLQTDAAINPGNSGGALIDINGALIGINTSIFTRSGGSNGIGFAIPANLVAQFLAQARAGNTQFQRPWAGLNGQGVDDEIAQSIGLEWPEGILIADVHPASPFRIAGLKPGDVIISVDGKPVNTVPEMIYHMTVAGIGNSITIAALREGEAGTTRVALAAAPETPPRAPVTLADTSPLPGLTLITVNPAVTAEFGLPPSLSGVLVADPGGPGARIGLRFGDLVLRVDSLPVATTAEAQALLNAATGTLRLDVQRGTQRITIRARR